MKSLKSILNRLAIATAMEKPAPDRIPMTGPRLQVRNYSVAHLGSDENPWHNLVRSLAPNGVHLYRFDDNVRTERFVPNEDLRNFNFHAEYYLREREIKYSSAARFILEYWTGLIWLRLLKFRFARGLYSARSLVKEAREKVLRTAFDEACADVTFRTSPEKQMTKRYGVGWVHHPAGLALYRYYTLLLLSLAETKELEHDGAHVFEVKPTAVATIAQFDLEERRHKDNLRLQWAVTLLTLVVAIAAGFQGYAAWRSIDPPPAKLEFLQNETKTRSGNLCSLANQPEAQSRLA